MYQQFFSQCEIKPYSVVVPLEQAYEYKQYNSWMSPYKKLFKLWLNPEFMTVESQNLVVNPDNKGFEDLNIKPISFGHKVHEVVQEVKWLYGARDVTKRDTANA